MKYPGLVVRAYQDNDWPAIWTILRDIAAAGDTFTYAPGLDEATGMAIWLNRSSSSIAETLVAVESGRLIGSAKVGANHPGPGAHIATASFIVAASARGLGAGRALLRGSLLWARSKGFEAMQFNAVASSNVAAIELYLSEGFQVVGTVPDAFRHPALGDVNLLVMHRKL